MKDKIVNVLSKLREGVSDYETVMQYLRPLFGNFLFIDYDNVWVRPPFPLDKHKVWKLRDVITIKEILRQYEDIFNKHIAEIDDETTKDWFETMSQLALQHHHHILKIYLEELENNEDKNRLC